MKWIREVLLQRYWAERCHEDEYYLEGARILGARMNPVIDAFPDITANDVAGLPRPVPAEVEWTTADFGRHEHPADKLKDSGGFLIVWKRTHDFPTPQVELQPSLFRDWLRESYGRLLDDTIRDVDREIGRGRDPRLWVIWRSQSVEKHMEKALSHGLWGFPDGINPNRLLNAQLIKPGDTVIFVGPWSGSSIQGPRTGGRVSLNLFRKGEIDQVAAYSVTRAYFRDSARVWSETGTETWSHRIGFDPRPVFSASSLPTSSSGLGRSLPEFLRRVMIGRSDPIELPPTLAASLLSAVGRNKLR